jgi:hypothetical protein
LQQPGRNGSDPTIAHSDLLYLRVSRANVHVKGGAARLERDLALILAQRFLMPRGTLEPHGVRTERELLCQEIKLARDDKYRRNRQQFYE